MAILPNEEFQCFLYQGGQDSKIHCTKRRKELLNWKLQPNTACKEGLISLCTTSFSDSAANKYWP